MLARALRLVAPALRDEAAAAARGVAHHVQEEDGEECEEDARHKLEEHRLHPVVGLEERGVRGRERAVGELVHRDGGGGGGGVGRGGGGGGGGVGGGDVDAADGRHQVVGQAEDDGRRVDARDGDGRAPPRTPGGGARRHADEERAEHGEADRQPDGDRVADDREADVHQHEVDPDDAARRRELARLAQHVEVDGGGQVGRHRQQVGDGEPQQERVGRGAHRGARQHNDVRQVGRDAPDADDDREVAVDGGVAHAERVERGVVALGAGRGGVRPAVVGADVDDRRDDGGGGGGHLGRGGSAKVVAPSIARCKQSRLRVRSRQDVLKVKCSY